MYIKIVFKMDVSMFMFSIYFWNTHKAMVRGELFLTYLSYFNKVIGLMIQSYVNIRHENVSSSFIIFASFEFKYFDSMRRNFGASQIHNIEHFTNHIDHARSRLVQSTKVGHLQSKNEEKACMFVVG